MSPSSPDNMHRQNATDAGPAPPSDARPFGAALQEAPDLAAEWPAVSPPSSGPSRVFAPSGQSTALQTPQSMARQGMAPQSIAPDMYRDAPPAAVPEARAKQRGVIETIASVQNGHTVQLTIAPVEDGRVRLMVMAFPKKADGAKKAAATESEVQLPFQPITAVDFPAALDDPEQGLVRAFTVLVEQEKIIGDILQETAAFDARRKEAEERLKKAKKGAETATKKVVEAEQQQTGKQSLFDAPPAASSQNGSPASVQASA